MGRFFCMVRCIGARLYTSIQRGRSHTAWLRPPRWPWPWAERSLLVLIGAMGLTDAGQDPNATRQADCGAELRPQQICFGLRSDAVSSYASENFEVLCRVVDFQFGHVSAELLFELRAAGGSASARRSLTACPDFNTSFRCP